MTTIEELARQLKGGTSELATTLATVDRDCLRGRLGASDDRHERVVRLLQLVPDRAAAVALSQAFGMTRWAGAYAESPYDNAMLAIRCAIDGVPLPSGSAPAQRSFHDLCVNAYALCSAQARWNLDDEGRRRRYRRLLRAMQQAALLTAGEADSALRALLRTNPAGRHHCPPSCEAVQHFGGCLRVVRAARGWRHRFAIVKPELQAA